MTQGSTDATSQSKSHKPSGSWLIRSPDSPEEYRACQEAQRAAWGITEEHYVVPVATMVGVQRHGGLVLGAFLEDGRAAGVSFAFLGRYGGERKLCLYSQLTGVIPEYQGRGLGRIFKRAQQEFARREGIEQIVWAFDPMQAGNAHFNLEVLGATVREFIVDMYGPRSDNVNAAMPTDRVIAVWPVPATDDSVAARAAISPEVVSAVPHLLDADPAPMLRWDLWGHDQLLLEIPAPQTLNLLRSQAPARLEQWRLQIRAAFLAALERGYVADRIARTFDNTSQQRVFYLLTREGA